MSVVRLSKQPINTHVDETDEPLCGVGVNAPAVRRHVGDGRETVGVQVPGGAMGRKRSARGAREAREAGEAGEARGERKRI